MFSAIGRAGEHTGRVFGTCWGMGVFGRLWGVCGGPWKVSAGPWQTLREHQGCFWVGISCHWRSLWETLGHLGAIWGSSEELLSVPGRHHYETLSIPWEIQHLNVPMMWF